MRFDCGLRDLQLVGNLFVEQSFRQHHQHAHLLRRQGRQPRHQGSRLGIGARPQVHVRRGPDATLEYAGNSLAHSIDAERLRDESRSPEVHAAADDRRIVMSGDDDDWHTRILRAQVHEAGKAPHARHRQVEQDEVDLATALEQFRQVVEGSGLGNIDILEQAGNRFPQRSAEQRMVVRNDQPRRFTQPFHLPLGISRLRPAILTRAYHISRMAAQHSGQLT